MIYVVCSTHRQFENFCREQQVSPKSKRFKYVWDHDAIHNLRGILNPNVIFYGLWAESRDASILPQFIESRQYDEPT